MYLLALLGAEVSVKETVEYRSWHHHASEDMLRKLLDRYFTDYPTKQEGSPACLPALRRGQVWAAPRFKLRREDARVAEMPFSKGSLQERSKGRIQTIASGKNPGLM